MKYSNYNKIKMERRKTKKNEDYNNFFKEENESIRNKAKIPNYITSLFRK